MSSKKLFSVNDKVFVKRRAYPAWPALIIGIKSNTESEVIYTVYFYGTGNYGECKANSLCLYEENKYKLAKPRRKQKKFKKLAEALELIENDTKNDFVPDNNVEVFMQPISTTNINQELSLEDESKNVSKIENQSEYNLKTEEMLTYEPVNESSSSKSIKVVLSKRVSNSAKRKLSDVTNEKVPKKLTKSKSFKPIDIQPIVLLEPLNDVYLQRKLNRKLNFKTAEKNVTANEQISETLNTTSSVLESSDVSLNHCETAESITINESVQSDLGRISRFGRKIKPNRLSDHDFVTSVPKNLKLKKADSKGLKTLNSDNNEIDDSLKQNVKSTDSSTKAIKKLKNNVTSIPVSIPCSLDSVSKKICLVNNSLHERNPPNNLTKNIMGSSSNVEVEWKQMESNKAVKVNLLLTEVNLLDCVNKLSSALSINYRKLSYEMALKSLEEISELQFNALMLIKHRCIIDKITKVTKYVGDVNNWSLSDQEAIEHVDKAHQIRCKARKVLNKCISLFTLTDGKTFQEIYNQEVDMFIAKTQHLSNDQIYGCTSDKLYK
ncbi:hepatoma-derived growth factor-related protein 2 [Metopolophium dirhodum]|uniref:hepatoma-derived growth factor-related protein 2 n=1 Tax=Metopolophium dirhodum TaxID=44670 RepID=UPI00299036A1|nr:hepatoma-derived growth factor-related protein 2 [Metopolophium dirhodum]